MQFKIEICCDNAAFEDNELGEVARILRGLVVRLESFSDDHIWSQSLFDINGNNVGFARTEDT